MIVALIGVASEGFKKDIEQRVRDWLAGFVRIKACFGGVRDGVRTVHQHMIPRLPTWWLGLIRLVPLIGGLARAVPGNYDTAIAVAPMLNQLAWLKFGWCMSGGDHN